MRRAGEGKLREDLVEVLTRWREEEEVSGAGAGALEGCGLFFVSVSKTLVGGFWEDVETALGGSGSHGKQSSKGGGGGREEIGLIKGGDWVRNIPMDFGRPSFDACRAVYDHMMRCTVVKIKFDCAPQGTNKPTTTTTVVDKTVAEDSKGSSTTNSRTEFEDIPLTPLHEAARDGNHNQLLLLLTNTDGNGYCSSVDVNTRAGPKLMTPLHYAASSTPPSPTTTTNYNPANCITTLLLHHNADPSLLDSHGRPPYYLSSTEAIRIAFRTARATLGEDTPYEWDDGGAKVGPPLTQDDVTKRNQKAKEKKRRQRKGKKNRKKVEREEEELVKKEEEAEKEKVRMEEESRRVRAGLAAKKKDGGGVKEGMECDFCQKVCVGKRRVQMFTRLSFVYCTVECVNRHKRELMAAAATARFSGGGGT